MSKTVQKLVSNTLFLTASFIITSLFSFLYWLILGKLFTPSEYGIVSVTINLSIFLSLITVLGLNMAMVKLVPEYLEQGQNKKVQAFLRFSFQFTTTLGILIGSFIIFASGPISGILKIPKDAMVLSGFIVFFMTLGTYFDAAFRGFQNMKIIPLIQFIGQVLRLLLAVGLIFLGFGYMGPLFGFLSLYIIMTIFGIKFVGIGSSSDVILNKREILLKYSLPTFISFVLLYIFVSGRYLILNILQDSTATGIFTLAIILATPISLFPNVFLQAIFPIASQLSIYKKRSSLTQLIRYFTRYSLLLSLPLVVFLVIFAKPLIVMFSSEKYLEATKLLPIVSIATILLSLSNIFHQTLYSLGKIIIYRNIVLASVLIFLAFSIPLTYKFSGLGMSFSFVLFSLVIGVLSFIQLKRFMYISIPFLSILKIVVVTSLSTPVIYLLAKLNNGLLWGVFSLSISLIVYFFLLIFLKFFEREDMEIIKNIVNRIPIFKKQLKHLANFLGKLIVH